MMFRHRSEQTMSEDGRAAAERPQVDRAPQTRSKGQEWWRRAVVYQVYPRSFKDSNSDGIGDIRGVKEQLPYIAKLGVDAIWLNPIYESPNVDNGYDISNYEQIQSQFGTLEDFDELVTEAHRLDIRIVLDLVVNHTSDQHEWFQRAISANPGPYRDFYIWKDAPAPGKVPNNWRSSFGGSAWEWNDQVGQYYLHLFAKQQPDLNWENPEVREHVYEIIRFWLRRGVDGFRMDVINLISKRPEFASTPPDADGFGSYYPGCANGPKVHEYIHELRQRVLDDPKLVAIGETPRTTADEAEFYTDPARGELDMIFHFEHMHIDRDGPTKWYIKPVQLADLRNVLSTWQLKLADHGWNSLYWSNHDQPRVVSRFGNDGKYRVESAKMLGTLLHMMRGTPFIYQGEELGMTNIAFSSPEDYDDIDSRNGYRDMVAAGLSHDEAMKRVHARSRDNARTPMQWDSSPNGGFTDAHPWLPVNTNYREINAQAAMPVV
jgi:oligo-1,6-glucosidase